ncbi:hypothetical protein ABPG74_014805 [Tetrahymena malaccensis]
MKEQVKANSINRHLQNKHITSVIKNIAEYINYFMYLFKKIIGNSVFYLLEVIFKEKKIKNPETADSLSDFLRRQKMQSQQIVGQSKQLIKKRSISQSYRFKQQQNYLNETDMQTLLNQNIEQKYITTQQQFQQTQLKALSERINHKRTQSLLAKI